MSSSNDWFDPARDPRPEGCVCGLHRSPAEHDHEAQRMLQCAAVESEDEEEGILGAHKCLRWDREVIKS